MTSTPDLEPDPVRRLGLGLAALGRPAYITTGRRDDLGADRAVATMQARTADVLDTAYAGGIRYVDAARSYGLAEHFLGAWLAARPDVDDVTVASKWGYRYVGDWRTDRTTYEVKDHSAAAFTAQLTESRAELDGRLSIYQIHSVTPDSPALGDGELLGRLARLRDDGVRVGLTTSGPRQGDVIRAALAVEVDGRPLFSVVQSTWNLLEPSAGAALREAADAGLHTVAKEVFANGRLTTEAGSDTNTGHLTAAARQLGRPVEQLALAAALSRPWLGTALTGAVTPDQVRDDLAALDLRLPTGDVEEWMARAEPPETYWSQRSSRPWT